MGEVLFRPTISDKIVDTLTFSNPHLFKFIPFDLVKLAYSLLHQNFIIENLEHAFDEK